MQLHITHTRKTTPRHIKHVGLAVFAALLVMVSALFVYKWAAATGWMTTVKVQSNVKDVRVSGAPLCGGLIDASGAYHCAQAGNLQTALMVPPAVLRDGKVWRLTKITGCETAWANTCQINARSGSGVAVNIVYEATNADLSGNTSYDSSAAASDIGDYTAVAVDNSNLPVVGYNVRNSNEQGLGCGHPNDPEECDLRILKCETTTCDNPTKTTVDSVGDVGQYASLTLGLDGLPVIAYLEGASEVTLNPDDGRYYRYCQAPGFDPDQYCNLKVLKCGNAACTAGNVVTRVDTAGGVGENTSIALGKDGLPVISYTGGPYGNTELRVLKCGNPACSAGNTISLADSGSGLSNQLFFTSIAMPADGNPIVAYMRYNGLNGLAENRLVKCGNPACSASNIESTFDTAEGGAIVLTRRYSAGIGKDGLPVISYFKQNDQAGAPYEKLKVLKCQNQSCSANSVTVADPIGFTGMVPSMAVGSDGLPLILYTAHATYGYPDQLKTLKCADAACASYSPTNSSIIGNIFYAASTALAIGPNNLPVGAYREYDFINKSNNLKLLRCQNDSCSLTTAKPINLP